MYAGTAVEEGEITLRVKKASGDTRFERIVTMIEESEQLKSTAEGKAATLADALVPWSLGGSAISLCRKQRCCVMVKQGRLKSV